MAAPAESSTDISGGKHAAGRRLKSKALAEFYGKAEGSDDRGAPSLQLSDPSDIDGNSFDAKSYYSALLKSKNLPSLMTIDVELKREIRKFDSELKMLVYENYNRFISATDTIRKMKTNVENMEAEMQRLSANFDQITKITTHINDSLSPNRIQICRYMRVLHMLKKRQFLLELPGTLLRCVEQGYYDTCVSYFLGAAPTLRAHPEVFRNILRECEAAMSQLSARLHEKLSNPLLPLIQVTQLVGHLQDVGESPASLRAEYMRVRGAVLERLLQAATGASTSASGNTPAPSQSLRERVGNLNVGFLGDLLEFSKTYQHLFMQRDREHRSDAKKQLEDFTRDVLSKYVTVVRSLLLENSNTSSYGTITTELIPSMEVVYKHLLNMHAQLPDLGFQNAANDIVSSTVTTQIERQLKSVNPAELLRQQAQAATTSDRDDPAVELCGSIQASLQTFVAHVKPFFEERRTSEDHMFLRRHALLLAEKLHLKLQQAFLTLIDAILEYVDAAALRAAPTYANVNLLLLLARVSGFLQTTVITQAHTLLMDFTPPSSHELFNRSEMIRRAKDSLDRCLSQCVQVSGTILADRVCASLGAGVPVGGVTAVRSEIDSVVKQLETLEVDVERFFPLHKKNAGSAGTMLSGMERSGGYEIFARRARLNAHIVPAKQPILVAIIKFMLKSAIEFTRSRTLTTPELQQTQVDVQYLRRLVAHFLEDSTLTNPMLDELQNSTAERCTEPALLESATVAKIASEKPLPANKII